MARKVAKRNRKPVGTWVKTIGQLAQYVGKRTDTVRTYRDKHGAPVEKTKHGYSVDALRIWMDKHGYTQHRHSQRPDEAEDNGNSGDEVFSTRDRLLRAQALEREAKAELAALKVKVEHGEFLPKEDVRNRDVARIAMVRRGLLALVKQLPPRLVGMNVGEMEIVLKEQIRGLLTRFSQM